MAAAAPAPVVVAILVPAALALVGAVIVAASVVDAAADFVLVSATAVAVYAVVSVTAASAAITAFLSDASVASEAALLAAASFQGHSEGREKEGLTTFEAHLHHFLPSIEHVRNVQKTFPATGRRKPPLAMPTLLITGGIPERSIKNGTQ